MPGSDESADLQHAARAARPICLITGATGALGPAVVAALARTHDIRTFSRQPPPPGLFDRAVTVFTGDITDRTKVRRAAAGADVIVHMAALLHKVNPGPHRRADYERVNVEGTAVAAEAARSEGARRFVYLSTIAVYGPHQGEIDEASIPAPDTMYGETKLAAERIALAGRAQDGAALTTVLRSAAVYGARVKGNYRSLVQAIDRRRFVPVGRGDNRRTVVFEADLAAAIALAATHPDAPGRIYNVSDGTFHRMRAILDEIAAALDRRLPRWHLPVPFVRMSAGLIGMLDGRVPRMVETYLEDVAVEGLLIQRELGFTPQFDLRRGWTSTIEQMRKAGALRER